MAVELPPCFVDLRTASSMPIGSEIHIIGVVSDYLSPRKSAGSDWTCCFSIADQSLGYIGEVGQEGLKVRFFRKLAHDLPQIWGTGDVVILRYVKWSRYHGIPLAMSSHGSMWTVIHAPSILDAPQVNLANLPHEKDARARPSTPQELKYAIEVCNHFDKHSYSSKGAPVVTPNAQNAYNEQAPNTARREKFSLIQDVQIRTYYDLVGQVVKIFPAGGRSDLYISDYTSNPLLYFYSWGQDDDGMDAREGDEYGYISRISNNNRKWPGPFGKLTLPVTLWSPHAEYAQGHVKEGDFVFLRNTHIRHDKDAKLVGSLHSDTRYPDRIDINVLTNVQDDDRVKALLRRKKEYHKKFFDQSEKFVIEARESKQSDEKKDDDDEPESKDAKPLSRNQRKRLKKQEKKKHLAQKLVEQPTTITTANTSKRKHASSDSENEPPSDSSPPPLKAPKLDSLNTNIRCSHHLTPVTPLPTILNPPYLTNTTPNGTTYTLTFQNVNLRTTARVIDFFPPDIADFAVRKRPQSEYAILSDYEASDSDNDPPPHSSSQTPGATDPTSSTQPSRDYEWRFALLLAAPSSSPSRHPPETLKAYVTGADAEYLLKLNAEDLHASPMALAALREKLFLLWGNLEERKQVALRERRDEGNGQVVGSGGRAFQCCLKEYGVKTRIENQVDDPKNEGTVEGWRWERRWRLWGCTIV